MLRAKATPTLPSKKLVKVQGRPRITLLSFFAALDSRAPKVRLNSMDKYENVQKWRKNT